MLLLQMTGVSEGTVFFFLSGGAVVVVVVVAPAVVVVKVEVEKRQRKRKRRGEKNQNKAFEFLASIYFLLPSLFRWALLLLLSLVMRL